jgi:hypothetical protein
MLDLNMLSLEYITSFVVDNKTLKLFSSYRLMSLSSNRNI